VWPQEWSHVYFMVQRKYCHTSSTFTMDSFHVNPHRVGSLWQLVHWGTHWYMFSLMCISVGRRPVVVLSGWTRLWPVSNARWERS
jgi:hypothetical protein